MKLPWMKISMVVNFIGCFTNGACVFVALSTGHYWFAALFMIWSLWCGAVFWAQKRQSESRDSC